MDENYELEIDADILAAENPDPFAHLVLVSSSLINFAYKKRVNSAFSPL